MSQTVTAEEHSGTLATVLEKHTREGELYVKLSENKVRCYSCGHRCIIRDHRPGICKVRFNEGGRLFVPAGYVGALQCDPIEKKPFFHALPGTDALSFGMLGCDFHCAYCQNWITSQAIRDPKAVAPASVVSARELVDLAEREGASTVASTYNEPLITSEWAVEVFREAKSRGFATAYISNGNGTPQVLDYIRPWVDLYKVDLKGFNDRSYRQLGGVLSNVLDTIQNLKARGFWVEIVTLLVPGFNNLDEEIRALTKFLASVDPLMPWHVTAFHQDYKMTDHANTRVEMLLRAAEIAAEAGLKYVYAGNLPGRVGRWEHTQCHECGHLLIERLGYRILKVLIDNGNCPECAAAIPGVWQSPRVEPGTLRAKPSHGSIHSVRFCG